MVDIKFAYWIPNVSGGLVVSKFRSAQTGLLITMLGWLKPLKRLGLSTRWRKLDLLPATAQSIS